MTQRLVADQQILSGVAATIDVYLTDQNGIVADAVGTVTVKVVKGDGTTVLAAGTATTHTASETGHYTRALTAAQTASLDLLTVTWTDSAGGSVVTRVEVVGRYWFSLQDAYAEYPSLIEKGSADAIKRRREVEREAEQIIGWSFVPRYRRVALDGTADDTLVLPDAFVRMNVDQTTVAVRSVRIYTDPTTFTSFTAAQLAQLSANGSTIKRPPTLWFDEGDSNIVVEYEHGWDRPPADLVNVAMMRWRSLLTQPANAVPLRAESWQSSDLGGNYRIRLPDKDSTGMPDVDAVYLRYREEFGGKGGPFSQTFDLDPSRLSVYHGGRR